MRSENPCQPVNADFPAANSDARPMRAQADDNSGYRVVIENLAADYPVSTAELAVIETYFGDILDALFKAASAEGEGAGVRAKDCSDGLYREHKPKAPGLKHGKISGRGRVRSR
jgi:hypothetical protein